MKKCSGCSKGRITSVRHWLKDDGIVTAWEAYPCSNIGNVLYERMEYCLKRHRHKRDEGQLTLIGWSHKDDN
jgi:hypothetical protein